MPDPVLPWDDKKIRISWCDDGQYFAVSSVDPITGKIVFHIKYIVCTFEIDKHSKIFFSLLKRHKHKDFPVSF